MTLPVVADLGPLLRRLARDEEAEQRQLAGLEARLRRFEDVERPAYERWLRGVHGPVVARIDELTAALRGRRMMAERVTELVETEGLHPREALWMLEQVAPAGGPHEDGGEPTAEEIAARRRAKRDRKRAERRRAERERRRDGRDERADAELAREPARRRLVGLYRTLARGLHPDSPTVVGTLAPERLRAVWSEVQAAYAVGSLERLIALSTWLTAVAAGPAAAVLDLGADTRPLSLAERHERLRALRRSARALERRLHALGGDPAWELASASASARKKLARAEGRRLAGEHAALEAELAEVEAFLAGIGPPRPPRRR